MRQVECRGLFIRNDRRRVHVVQAPGADAVLLTVDDALWIRSWDAGAAIELLQSRLPSPIRTGVVHM